MGWDGNGNFVRTNGTNTGNTVWQDDRDDGVKIRADRHDTHDQDLAGGIENTVALDGQNTTTTGNAILRYNAGQSKFAGVSIGTNEVVVRQSSDLIGLSVSASRIVGRKATGDVGVLTPSEARTVMQVGDSVSPVSVTDGGTDAYQGDFGRDVSADETVRGDFGSANTTTTPTIENTGGTPAAQTITTKDGSALWANALEGVHTVQLASDGNSWLVLDPNPSDQRDLARSATSSERGDVKVLDEDDFASDSADHVPTQQSAKAYVDELAVGALVPLSQATASDDAAVDFTSDIDGTYDVYLVTIIGVTPASDNDNLNSQTSTDGGSNWDGGSGYAYANWLIDSDGSNSTSNNSAGGAMRLVDAVGAASGESISGEVYLYEPAESANETILKWDFSWVHPDSGHRRSMGGGRRAAAESVNAVRFEFGNSNIASGTFRLYGVKNS